MQTRSRERKQGAGEKMTAIGFVMVAGCAIFLSMHKEAVMEGRIFEVLASYIG